MVGDPAHVFLVWRTVCFSLRKVSVSEWTPLAESCPEGTLDISRWRKPPVCGEH
jgi:hypothetical protein